jgi:hypothetical protein
MRLADLDPKAAPEALAASRAPLLVGVRHHSAALAAAMPTLLEAYAPTVIAVELPADLGAWIPWLGHPELGAPVALSATCADGSLAFYPFADFSPELSALRWAVRNGVEVLAVDRPVSAPAVRGGDDAPGAGKLLARVEDGDDVEALWDRMVEVHGGSTDESPHASAERLRRAALAFGWLLRADTLAGGGIPAEDRARESHMRAAIGRALKKKGARVAAVIGAFHANALLDRPVFEQPHEASEEPLASSDERMGALVPYDFELFDSRSGYPAGIRDPSLVQRAYELHVQGLPLEHAMPELLVAIARELREKGHVASFADVREAMRLACDLATLRGQGSPGRRELVEAIETTMAQGELLGRGRALARAMSVVLVGHRRGHLAPDTPRSGLALDVEKLVERLGLPGPTTSREAKELTLDPSRSELDRERAIVLGRLEVCGVPYAERRSDRRGNAHAVRGTRADVETLTQRVSLRYTAETAARVELSGMFGSTLESAAEGALRRSFARLVERGEALAAGFVAHLDQAAEAGLGKLFAELLDRLHELFVPNAGLADLAAALVHLARVDEGLRPTLSVAALPHRDHERDANATRGLAKEREDLAFAALRALDGMLGTTEEADIVAFGELLALFARQDLATLRHVVSTFVDEGSPLVRGAGMAAKVVLEVDEAPTFYTSFVSLFDRGADDVAAALARTASLRGALLVAGATLEGDPRFAEAVLDGLDRLDDATFLARLPSLRGGFDVLSAGDRQRMLEVLGAHEGSLTLTLSPEALAAHATADRAAHAALVELGLAFPVASPKVEIEATASMQEPTRPRRSHAIGLVDRVRLVLGRERESLTSGAAGYARALDELYGTGHGEGSRGGRGESYPTAREWGDDLASLFGHTVREEVLAEAARGGNAGALLLLNAEEVTPSVELLERILSLKGGLSDREFSHLKRLSRRITEALVKELATRAMPALVGLGTPRSTRRTSGQLDLRRTIRQNLGTAYPSAEGPKLAPKSFAFRARTKKSLDWRIVLVVDVSGSMEPSVIHSAIMAGILGGLPAISTHFLAVNDRVVDLTEAAPDPLELLLSVAIGGGTLLAKGLRHARSLLTVPSRSIVVLVSDFEEGGSVGELVSEVRALRDSGAVLLGLAALGENHAPRYHRAIAAQLVEAGMPIAALSPVELASWVGERIRGAR